jgi:predicted AlkP superfamily phosphohydrolase/phosphomutase
LRVLVLGFDALAPELVFSWARAGMLPSFEKLLREGVWGWLESVPNANSAAAWSSFATGLEPGKHNIFGSRVIVPGTYYVQDLNGSHRLGAPFWRRLGNLGYRTGVVNVPMTYPVEPLAGFAVAGRDAPTHRSLGFSYPPAFFGGISRRMQHSYCIEAKIDQLATRGQQDKAARAILDCLEARCEFVLCALEEEVPEFLLVVFTAADVAQHLFFGHYDPQASAPQISESDNPANFVQQVYRQLDETIAKLTRRIAPDVVIIIAGLETESNKQDRHLFQWLRNVGLLYTLSGQGSPWSRLDNLLANAGTVFQKRPASAEPVPMLARVDWARTRAYCAGTGGIYINLQGREPQGSVPESQYESLGLEIIEQLYEIVDPITKASAIKDAVMSRDAYDIPIACRVPDIVIQWRKKWVLEITETSISASKPVQESLPLENGWSRSFFLAAGTGIQKGKQVRSSRITDFAPTLLHLFGDTVPDCMDGRVVADIFSPEWMAMHPVVTGERVVGQDSEENPMMDDTALVEERLRNLGYIQ